MRFSELLDQIVAEENAEPMKDVKELVARIFHRLGLLLDENDPFIGSNELEEGTDDV